MKNNKVSKEVMNNIEKWMDIKRKGFTIIWPGLDGIFFC
jgi:hypothetical protein